MQDAHLVRILFLMIPGAPPPESRKATGCMK